MEAVEEGKLKRMPGHRVILGEIAFNTKAEAKAHCKAMLGRYRNGQQVNEQDSQFLRCLLERHRPSPSIAAIAQCTTSRHWRFGIATAEQSETDS